MSAGSLSKEQNRIKVGKNQELAKMDKQINKIYNSINKQMKEEGIKNGLILHKKKEAGIQTQFIPIHTTLGSGMY